MLNSMSLLQIQTIKIEDEVFYTITIKFHIITKTLTLLCVQLESNCIN